MAYQLVLQLPAESIEDYDAVVELEDRLMEQLDDGSDVDGHDTGGGVMNVFILTDDPRRTFERARGLVEGHPLAASMRAGFIDEDDDDADYVPLWPEDLERFELL